MRGLFFGALCLCCGLPTLAVGQAAVRVGEDPPLLPDDFGSVERAAPQGARLRPGVRLSVVYVDDPLVAVSTEERALVAERLSFTASASLAFLERAFITIGGSVNVQGGFGASGLGEGGTTLASPAAGPPIIDGRVVLMDRDDPLELALATTLRLPFGSFDGYVTDVEVSVAPRVLVGRALDERGSYLGLSIGADLRPEARVGDLQVGSMLTFALVGAVGLSQQAAVTVELRGATVFARAFEGAHTPLRGTIGFRWHLDPLSVMGWVGTGLSSGFGSPDAIVGLAISSWIPI